MNSEVELVNHVNEKRGIFLENLVQCFGNKTLAAKMTRISRTAVFKWEKESPEYKELVRQAIIDGEEFELESCAEVVQEAAMVGRDWKAAVALLERKHKKRGWNKSIEHTGADGKPIELIQFYMPGNSRDNEEEEDETD